MKKILIYVILLLNICGGLLVYADIAHIDYHQYNRIARRVQDYPAKIGKIWIHNENSCTWAEYLCAECMGVNYDKSVLIKMHYFYPQEGNANFYIYDDKNELIWSHENIELDYLREIKKLSSQVDIDNVYTQKDYDNNEGFLKYVWIFIPPNKLDELKENKFTIKITYKKKPSSTRFGKKKHLGTQTAFASIILEKIDNNWVISENKTEHVNS